MLAAALDELAASEHDSGLRATQQLVAGDQHEVRALLQALRGGELAESGVERAAAEIVQQVDLVHARDRGQLGKGRHLGEAEQGEVRSVDAKDRRPWIRG